MYIVTNWNWGWYKKEYERFDDAVYAYCQESQIAELNHNPEPMITDEKGNEIELQSLRC